MPCVYAVRAVWRQELRQAQAERLACAEVAQPLGLQSVSLLRTHILRLDASEYCPMEALEDQLAALSPDQRRLVERWLREQPAPDEPPSHVRIPRRSTDTCPLSFDQQQLWFLYQWDATSSAYNFPIAVRLRGPCDLAALARSLNMIVERHEALRTIFLAPNGQPQQRVAPHVPIPLRRLDLDRLPLTVREAQITHLARGEVAQPFDLEHGPLLRARTLRLAPTEHILLITIHHIVFDNWSQGILIRELLALYTALCAGQAAALPALPLQYGDYALWQRQHLQGRLLAEQLAFWTAQLRDAPALLDLPTDHPRPPIRSVHGTNHIFGLPAALCDQLHQLSRQSGVTLFMLLLTAFDVLLYRYSGQTDLVVGTSVAGRSRAELEPLIGMFVNRLALRTNLAGNPTARVLLQRVRAVALAAYAHQDIAFEQVLDALRLRRDLSRHPLFQTMLVLQTAPMPRWEQAGLSVRPLEVPRTTAQFDLALFVREGTDGLHGRVKYSTDLFDPPTIQRMFGQFVRLLGGMVADLEQPLNALPLLSVAERAQLLLAWNDTGSGVRGQLSGRFANRPYGVSSEPSDFWLLNAESCCLHQLFEAQAARSPDAIALVYETNDERRTTKEELSGFVLRPSSFVVHVTYRELDCRANQLARYLRARGVGPEVRVGVCVERSLMMLVALLGVLKAGGAYVPLDPAYPPERLAFMIEDSGVQVLLVAALQDTETGRYGDRETRRPGDTEIAPLLVSLSPCLDQVVELDADWPQIARCPATAPGHSAYPEHLMYVIYTSGSTGAPKGVMVTQRGVVNLLVALRDVLGISAADRLLALTTLAFDIAGLELYLPLIVGAGVVIASRELARDGSRLAEALAAQRVTVLQATPATWRLLLAADWVGQPGLRLLCGGEALAGTLAQALTPRGRVLWNLYGPTETTIWSSAYRVPRAATGTSVSEAAVPIGRPLANTTLYVLDRAWQLAPIGVPGELYVGGAGLARGYLGRPDLTAERFVPNSFAGVSGVGYQVSEDKTPDTRYPAPGTRLYKTGDLVRYRADGAIEYLGRSDQQVKLRGFRIELGEIETVLVRHPQVRASVVRASEKAPGDVRLVAYVVPTEDEGRTTNDEGGDSSFVVRPSSLANELRAFLAAQLPEYMIPSAFVLLDALPLTPNGKLDRAALPALEWETDQPRDAGPYTPTEELLADIWGALLGVARVGLADNFFEIGGHSLLATQVVARMRQVFAVELPVRTLFETPTLAALAARIVQEHQRGGASRVPPLVPQPRTGAPPLSFAQERLWFLDQLDPGSASYNIPVALRLRGALDVLALAQAFHIVQTRHETLRTTFGISAGLPVQHIGPPQPVHLPLLDLTGLPTAAHLPLTHSLAQADAGQPFDLARGPLWRVALVRLTAADHALLLNLHHTIADAWSLDLLVHEVAASYNAQLQGQTMALPALPLQYADYALWQRAWLQRAALETQLAYWRAQLADAPAVVDLPTDRPRPAVQRFAGASVPVAVDTALVTALRAVGRRAGATLFMTVLAAFDVVLARYSSQDDVLIGTPIAGRQEQVLEGLIGCFVNTLVLRAHMQGNPRFSALLAQLRGVCIDAYAHQDLPFEKLVEALNVPRALSYAPLFQVLFALQNVPQSAVAFTGVELAPLATARRVAKFELSLLLNEHADGLRGVIEYNTDLFDAATIDRLAAHLQTLLAGVAADPEQPIGALPLLTLAERSQFVAWNATATAYPQDACLHELFAVQAARTPDAIALVCGDAQLSYRELDTRANRLAHYLRGLGIGPDQRVGIALARSLDLLVGLLGILKAGGAYVPLDPAYPAERLAFMLADSQAAALITADGDTETRGQGDKEIAQFPISLSPDLLVSRAVVDLRADWPLIAQAPAVIVNPKSKIQNPDNLAYVIYTSGSTGRPKGVLISHRNVVNCFAGMDSRVGCAPADRLLALTSISFDISVLELFWPLTRGACLLLDEQALQHTSRAPTPRPTRPLEFSLFYFASADAHAPTSTDTYRLVIEGAKFADAHGFTAIWTPERHFHAFGGLYPNPSVLSAALALVTERVQLRAGSVVLPLHSPIRVAEEWALVDNLSHGRVGIAFASGWHADDFALSPTQYADRKQVMFDGITTVQQLWRGEAVTVRGGAGNQIAVQILPRPIQPELPIWITAAGSPETFVRAGALGANVLTHLLGQTLEEVAQKIQLYRAARAQHGHDPHSGCVTLMLHTFVGTDHDAVREQVRVPFTNYLRTSVGLIENMIKSLGLPLDLQTLQPRDLDDLLAFAFERYFETSALFGTPETCLDMLAQVQAIGVDEVACLIDFGVDIDAVLTSLPNLNELRVRANAPTAVANVELPARAQRQRATLLQCTPSTLRMLTLDPDALAGLRSLRALLLGGEVLPPELAAQMTQALPGRVLNMYGPTETTIWSATHALDATGEVAIGQPIANTTIFILDRYFQRVPVGVTGELYIGGDGLARGYLGRSDLTAERFVPNPFESLTPAAAAAPPLPRTGEGAGGEGGKRLYKTGDLARYHPDGNIEFLGRLDQQVKLRGYRIELGEIGAVLAGHPALREAVVAAWADGSGEQRLVAYVVPAETLNAERRTINRPEWSSSAFSVQRSALEGELRAFLRSRLPDYMIPAVFVALDALPLTANGKVDRRALPLPEGMQPSMSAEYTAPRNALEERLVGIWAGILKREPISIHDSFFDLGGHSLLATRLIIQIREVFQIVLPLRVIFEAPTVADLAEVLAQHMGKSLAADDTPAARIPRRSPTDVCPLAFAQQPLWFVQQWDPDSTAFNFPIAVRLRGPCDLARLEHSLNTIVQRHEALRTTFPALNGQPQQVIAPAMPLRMRRVDLDQLPIAVMEPQAEHLARTAAAQPFDLEHGPVIRAQILRLDATDHVLLIALHHIIFDDWSQGVFMRELIALYAAARGGDAAPLPALPIQYGDYATWQRRHLPGSSLDEQLAFWAEHLRHAPPLLDLPTDYPRPPIRSARGAAQPLVIAASLVDSLNALSRQAGATLFMTLLAAFDVLLARHSGQEDFVVGTPIAGRNRSELEGLIGLFVNVLPLRMDLTGNPPFRELLQRVRSLALAAYAYQDVVFEQLVDALAVERDPSRHPIFQVMLVLQNTPMPTLAGPDLRIEPLELERTTAHYELGLSLREGADGLQGRFEYSTDLFTSATIQRLCEQFIILLDGIVANPDQCIAALPLLTAAERAQVLAWNATETPYSHERSLPALVQMQAARTPDAVAIVFRDQQLSYAELVQRANRLAHYLRAQQVGPEVRVGVCLERSLELVVALLGVLTAGAAYIPLDPTYPPARLAFMLTDSQASVLITDQGDTETSRQGDKQTSDLPLSLSPALLVSRSIIDMAADWPLIARQPTDPPALPLLTDLLAYIIYTSGSTGTPKGVLVTHRGLSNVIPYAGNLFALDGHSRVLQVASISFDASVLELFAALAHGACVVLLALEQLGGGSALEYLLDRQAITTLIVTPSFLDLLPLRAYPRLRTISLGGERCTAATLARWATGRRVLNVYAPTEATIFATAWRAGEHSSSLAPPLGHPIANMQLYLLDRHLQPVPIGVTGEIYLGGVGLARGYHDRAELTAERFVPNPWGSGFRVQGSALTDRTSDPRPLNPEPWSRLYKTGDLARVRADGQIEFLGRRDDQIKLRGYRIELGEIAAALMRHPAVREAVVLAREDRPGEQRLIAYVVPTQDERRTTNEEERDSSFVHRPSSFVSALRAFLAERLPEYMLPSAFVQLDALPLTPTGKLDRRALPVPALRAASAAVAPRNRLELQLVQLWEELLDVRPIGVTDPFFALGGHSLLAVRLMAQLRELTGLALPIATLFHHPTIEQLAQLLHDQTAPAAPSALVGITTTGTKRPLFCVHPLGGNVLCYAQLARLLGPEQPVYGIQSLGLEHDQALPTDVESMAAQYVEAIRAFQPAGPYLLCGWSVGGVIAVEIAQQLAAQEQTVALLALIDSYTPQAIALPPPEDRHLLILMARQLGVTLDPAALQPLDAEQQLAYALAQAQRDDAMLPGLDLAQFRRLFAVYKANALALLRYTPRPYRGRMTLFRAALGLGGVDPAQGWDALSSEGVGLCDVPGEHDSMLREPHVRVLAERLNAAIAACPD